MKKKLVSAFLASVIAVLLTACGGEQDSSSAQSIGNSETEKETEESAQAVKDEISDETAEEGSSDDFHIGIVTGSFSQSEDDRRGAEAFQEKYGDLMSVYPLEIPEAVTARFSNTLLVICLLIAFLSGSITAFIYQYLLQRSSRTFRIYRLCGMSAEQVRLLCFAEFISLQVFSVLIGLLGYHFIIMPILDKSLVYLSDAYNLFNYIKLVALYLATSLSIIVFMMNSEEMKNTWVNI